MNKLLYDHQLAILRAQHAALGEGDANLRDRTDLFAIRIADWRSSKSLPTAGWPSHAEARMRDAKRDGQIPHTAKVLAP